MMIVGLGVIALYCLPFATACIWAAISIKKVPLVEVVQESARQNGGSVPQLKLELLARGSVFLGDKARKIKEFPLKT
eukprot:2884510-Amphidinium_carterae.1